MGAEGTDAAVDTADAVLATDDLRRVPEALRIARRTRRLVWTNVALAVGIKLAVLVLSAFGLAGMWAAVFADTGVVLLCVAVVLLARFPAGRRNRRIARAKCAANRQKNRNFALIVSACGAAPSGGRRRVPRRSTPFFPFVS